MRLLPGKDQDTHTGYTVLASPAYLQFKTEKENKEALFKGVRGVKGTGTYVVREEV